MCSIDLNSIAASEKPADVDYVAKYQKLIAELLYLSVNTMSEIGLLRVVWRGIWPNQLSNLESTKTASCKVCLGEKRCQIDFVCQQKQAPPSLWRYQRVCWFASGWRKDFQKVDKLSLYKILMIMTHAHTSHAHNHQPSLMWLHYPLAYSNATHV